MVPLALSGFDYEVSSRAKIGKAVTEPGCIPIHGKLLADGAPCL
jgi:DNA polymerase III subunit beta